MFLEPITYDLIQSKVSIGFCTLISLLSSFLVKLFLNSCKGGKNRMIPKGFGKPSLLVANKCDNDLITCLKGYLITCTKKIFMTQIITMVCSLT